MKRVVFYFEPNWAFGTVHYELCKYLYGYGFDCRLLPWNKSYTYEEMRELNDTTDIFVTTPHGWRFLGYDYKTVKPEQCVIISHAKLDMTELIHYHGYDDFNRFKRYACVSDWLVNLSAELGIQRPAELTPVAINYNAFYSKPNDSLRTVGYAGSFHGKDEFAAADIQSALAQPKYHKRAWLVQEATERAGLTFIPAGPYHNSFVTMPGFYKRVDAVIAASTEEGAGLPVMEGGAAGKLIISTPVGHWNTRITEAGGHAVPTDDVGFVEKTTELLSYYKNNPEKYRQRCLEIQHHAQSYDWKYVIDKWVDILTN
jgi:glycosyltransferase involved in cell wall biosynthesis